MRVLYKLMKGNMTTIGDLIDFQGSLMFKQAFNKDLM